MESSGEPSFRVFVSLGGGANDAPAKAVRVRGGESYAALLGRIAAKLDRLPLDDIAAETRRAIAGLASAVERTEALMQRLDGLASNEVRAAVAETQQTMAEARAAVADGRRLLASDAPLQQDLRDSLQELSRAAQSLRHLTDMLERNPEALLRGKPEEKP